MLACTSQGSNSLAALMNSCKKVWAVQIHKKGNVLYAKT